MNDGKKAFKNEPQWWVAPMAVFMRLSGWIAGPLLFALFLGKMVDKRYGTAPWFFLGLTGLAFLVSMVVIVKTATQEINKINKKKDE